MPGIIQNHQLNLKLDQDYFIPGLIEAFLIAKKVENLSLRTIQNYKEKLKEFENFCDGQEINNIFQIDPNLIRRFLLKLEENNHNPGGISGFYRPLKTFLRWFEFEFEPEGWINPINKIKGPRVPVEPLEAIPLENINKVINICGSDLLGNRDKALILFLLDTGSRAREALNIDREDIDLITGEILIRQGKGRKPRHVYIGKTARKALRNYLKNRDHSSTVLWANRDNTRMEYSGLRSMLRRRCKDAGVDFMPIHAFRRTFAINMLRAGCDVFTLQKLMGHADLQVLRRYLAQNDNDLQEMHERISPADRIN